MTLPSWLAEIRRIRYPGRFGLVLVALLLLLAMIVGRLCYLHLPFLNHGYLQDEGNKRSLRTQSIPAHRGQITDRNGEPLAVSTPMIRLAISPKDLLCWMQDPLCTDEKLRGHLNPERPRDAEKLEGFRRSWVGLCDTLEKWFPDEVSSRALQAMVRDKSQSNHEYLLNKRRLTPDQHAFLRREFGIGVLVGEEVYQRYYPASETTAHLIGFTGTEDNGVEGIELAYEQALHGESGSRMQVKNSKGQVTRDLGVRKDAMHGQNMALSIDLRLQHLALRELQRGVQEAGAIGGTAVLIDVSTGEILAMVNAPSYNPNNPRERRPELMRNRAVVDVMEPGSTMKPFSALAALGSGRWSPDSVVAIPGKTMQLNTFTIRDVSDAHGSLTLTGILIKSSNIGITKVAMDIGAPAIRDVMYRVGFGQSTGIGFPGEGVGLLPNHARWPLVETATLAYGYGLAITPLQLAQGYAVLGNLGKRVPLTLQRRDTPPMAVQVLDPQHVRTLLGMLQHVVEDQGGVFRAQVPGYHVAGKSGTARKNGGRPREEDKDTASNTAAGATAAKDDGYRYRGMFAGVAPATAPRLALAVVIDEPDKKKAYYGGVVAAPVFSRIMAGALRLLNVAPDNLAPAAAGPVEETAPDGGRD